MTIDTQKSVFSEPETVHIGQLKKDLTPLSLRIGDLVKKSDLVMIGEGNHFDKQTKRYSEQIFRQVIESADRRPIVFLEARSVEDQVINHFDYAVKYCEENGIPYYAIDTANTSHDSGLRPERDATMAENIEMYMKSNPGCVGVFVGGSNHCNKEGTHLRDLSEQYNDGYNYENAASLLIKKLRVGSVLSHYMDRGEVLASSVDSSEELMCLPGRYSGFYGSKEISDFSKVLPLRRFVSGRSFDLVTFIPTLEARICKLFGKNTDGKVTYIDEEGR